MKFQASSFATAIGSLPYDDPKKALGLVFDTIPEAPIWPQLPKRGFKEAMYTQFSEGLPAIRIDESEKRMWFDTSRLADELEGFYNSVIDEDIERFAISEEYACGLHAFLGALKKREDVKVKYLKGHITGPITFGLGITDEERKSAFYNDELKDVVIKGLAMKARWQVRQLKRFSKDVIIFIDEPYLVSIGSSFVSLKREDTIQSLNEVIDAIHKEDAFTGIHCCGNTDWSLLTDTNVDIINFDAYNYLESLMLYEASIKRFLERGSAIAWGIVPTVDTISQVKLPELVERMRKAFKLLKEKGFREDLVQGGAIFTPSCGMGSLSVDSAERCMQLLKGLAEAMTS
ncbi:MAG: methionine synthase [Candidatus Omnitrophica bacterium]|nr:methionine synthase [Candidatus Omnitrophota bacterium]